MTPPVRRRIERTAKATAGQYSVRVSTCRKFVLPFPTVDEEHRIVAEVYRRLSIVREVEAEVDANLKRAQALRQAAGTGFLCGRLSGGAGAPARSGAAA